MASHPRVLLAQINMVNPAKKGRLRTMVCFFQAWQIQRELTLQASLRPGVCRRRTSNGVPWVKLNEPWINAREDRMRKGNGASVAQCATRPSNHLRTWLVRADMATFKCVALPRLDMLNRCTLGQCTAPEVCNLMQDLDVDLGPTGLSLLRAPPLHVFTEALAGLQKGDSARRMDLGALGRLGGLQGGAGNQLLHSRSGVFLCFRLGFRREDAF